MKRLKCSTLPEGEFLPLDDFLRAARAAGVEVTRRALQFYYSPRVQLLPPPVYRGGHVAHFDRRYLRRLKAIKTLQTRYALSLQDIRELLAAVKDEDIRILAEGRIHPLAAQIVLHNLRLRNASRPDQERALFETLILLVDWHAWVTSNPDGSHGRPSVRPRRLDNATEREVRHLVAGLQSGYRAEEKSDAQG